MKKKWISEIKRSGDNLTFILSNGESLKYNICRNGNATFLNYHGDLNDKIFYILGIEKYKFYCDLGIQSMPGGDCPYCREEDVDILLKALLEWRPAGFETTEQQESEVDRPRESSEWDWLLD